MENTFSRVRSAKDIIISLSLIILGFILMFLPYGVGMIIGGFFFFLIGALFLFLFKSAYKLNGGSDIYVKKELYFNHDSINSILKAVLDNPKSLDVSKEGQGKSVKLNIYYSKQGGKAFLQLYEYVPYMYEPLTDVIQYDIKEISNLIYL